MLDVKEIFEEIDKATIEITKNLSHRIMEGIENSIGHPHICLLMYLKSEGETIVTDIARHLGITLSAVTNLTDKLYNLGFIERNRKETDRRIVVISLKEEGMKIIEKVCENRNKVFEEYFSDISSEEMETFLNITKKIRKNVSKTGG